MFFWLTESKAGPANPKSSVAPLHKESPEGLTRMTNGSAFRLPATRVHRSWWPFSIKEAGLCLIATAPSEKQKQLSTEQAQKGRGWKSSCAPTREEFKDKRRLQFAQKRANRIRAESTKEAAGPSHNEKLFHSILKQLFKEYQHSNKTIYLLYVVEKHVVTKTKMLGNKKAH